VVQTILRASEEQMRETIHRLISSQKKVEGINELFFVLADENNQPVYHVRLSELCEKFSEHFNDLTNGNRCDNISP
jgi:hypothetical protein